MTFRRLDFLFTKIITASWGYDKNSGRAGLLVDMKINDKLLYSYLPDSPNGLTAQSKGDDSQLRCVLGLAVRERRCCGAEHGVICSPPQAVVGGQSKSLHGP